MKNLGKEKRKFRIYSGIFVLINLFLAIIGLWLKWQTVWTIGVIIICLFYPLFMIKKFWNKIGDNWLVIRWINILMVGIFVLIFGLPELLP